MNKTKLKIALSVAGLCVALSIASHKPKFTGQKVLIFVVGLMASSAVTGKVTTQSSWERNSTKEFQTLEDEREALAIEKSEFLKTKQTFEQEKDQKLAAIGDKEALIQREVKAGIAEENVKFTKWQTEVFHDEKLPNEKIC